MMDAWSEYWKMGFGSTVRDWPVCLAGESETTLYNLWRDYFSSLPAGSKVVDIGCGNGLLLDLLEQSSLSAWRFTGLDVAQITERTSSLDMNRSGRLIGGTTAESVDFAQDPFDVLVSMNGFEYCDYNALLQNIGAALSRGSIRLFLIMHAKNSVLYQNSLKELDFYYQIERSRILHKLAYLDGVLTNSLSMRRKRDAFSALLNSISALSAHPGTDSENLKNALERLANRIYEVNAERDISSRRDIDALHNRIITDAKRLRLMCSAALDEAHLENLIRHASDMLGLSINRTIIYDKSGSLLFWNLST
ncbi:MAG TPA: class I SAM-dependent methyltransferase [Permianibacter sp.]|nr:class I SAM-dependent methyltransferase [Permianibacter sp.]